MPRKSKIYKDHAMQSDELLEEILDLLEKIADKLGVVYEKVPKA